MVSPTNSPVMLGVSPAATSTPMGVFKQRFEALFPCTGALGCVVCFALTVPPSLSMRECGAPPGLSMHECGAAGSASYCTACPIPQSTTSLGPPAATLQRVLSTPATVSTPPTGLDECLFFISLVVRLPYSLIFCQFWLFLF